MMMQQLRVITVAMMIMMMIQQPLYGHLFKNASLIDNTHRETIRYAVIDGNMLLILSNI